MNRRAFTSTQNHTVIHEALRRFAGIAEDPLSKKFPLVFPEKEKLAGLWG